MTDSFGSRRIVLLEATGAPSPVSVSNGPYPTRREVDRFVGCVESKEVVPGGRPRLRWVWKAK